MCAYADVPNWISSVVVLGVAVIVNYFEERSSWSGGNYKFYKIMDSNACTENGRWK